MAPYWEPGTQYVEGSIVEYEGAEYKIIQPHRSQSDWAPPLTPALWGRLQDGDHHGGHHGHQQQQQPQQQQPYSDSGYNQEKPAYAQEPHPDNKTDVQPEEHKKNWYDLDDERKKQLEIGGGLLGGIALLGGGYLAYKEHGKHEEEKKANIWGLQSWVSEAKNRTEEYRRNGPRGPVTWILNEGTNIPDNAILGGEEHDWKLYICRAFYEGSLQIGKASNVFKKGAVIGYSHEEIQLGTYEILVGDRNGVKWVDAQGTIDVNALGATPVEGGREADGTPLYIIHARHNGFVHPGKASVKLNGAFIPYDGTEKRIQEYRVLCYA